MSGRPELLWPCLLAAAGPPRLAAAAAGPPAARLALVLHGVPLIQGPHVRPSSQSKGKPIKQPQPQPQQQPATTEPPRDSNPLPRIIKPRKRRKKERKQPPSSPPPAPSPPAAEPQSPTVEIDDLSSSTFSSSPADSVTLSCTCSYCDPSNDTWDFTPPSNNTSFSSSWDVSSEIVTSANGHRDLEIKFILPPPKTLEPSINRSGGSAPPPPWSSREE